MRDLVHRYYGELWNDWDDGAVEHVLSSDFEFRGSLGLHSSGRGGWRAYRDLVRAGAADFHNTIEELLVEGDRAAAQLVFTGTHTGELLDLPATGRAFRYAGAAFFRARDERLCSAWVIADLRDLTQQLR